MPTINPAIPIKMIIEFLKIIHVLAKPVRVFQNVQHSMTAGKARPNADRHSAPKSEMNNSKFGMATANKTVLQIMWIINKSI